MQIERRHIRTTLICLNMRTRVIQCLELFVSGYKEKCGWVRTGWMSPVLISGLEGRAKPPPMAAKLEGVVTRGKTVVGAQRC